MIKPQTSWVNSAQKAWVLYLSLFLVLCNISLKVGAAEQTSSTQEQSMADDAPSYAEDGIIAVVGSPYVELYAFPGRAYPRFHAIEKNERIRIFKSRGDWYKIQTEDGKLGWAPRKNLLRLHDTEGNLLNFVTPKWGETENRWQFGLLGGTMEEAASYSLYTGYRFTSNISLELRYTQSFAESSDIKQAHLLVVHQPFPKWRVTPFFTLGAGTVKIYPFASLVKLPDEVDTAITVGGGLMFYLTHNVLLRADYNSHLILTTRKQNEEVEEWKAGFSVLF